MKVFSVKSFLVFLLICAMSVGGYFATSVSTEAINDADDTIYDGNVSEEEALIYQEAWCDYNKGRDFAKKQCE